MKGYEKNYHETVHDRLINNRRYYETRAKLARMKYFKGIPENARILEFSCGLGQDTFYFPNAVGFDISEYCLDFCRNQGKKVINDLNQVEDHSFDVVFSSHTLEHVDNPYEVLVNLRKKLDKDGILILVLPCEHHGKANFELDVNQHLFCWNFRAINNLLINTGYTIAKNKYFRGIGYDKLLFTSYLGIGFYRRITQLAAYIFRIKELYIIARPK